MSTIYLNLTESSHAIAFTAQAPGGNHEYAHGDTVIFSHIITNIGGHYDPSNSTFTCPVDGTYMFAVNIVSGYGEHMSVYIVNEGIVIFRGVADDIEGAHNSGSSMALTACSAHEQVWVGSNGSGTMYGGYHCHFSGFLLHPGV